MLVPCQCSLGHVIAYIMFQKRLVLWTKCAKWQENEFCKRANFSINSQPNLSIFKKKSDHIVATDGYFNLFWIHFYFFDDVGGEFQQWGKVTICLYKGCWFLMSSTLDVLVLQIEFNVDAIPMCVQPRFDVQEHQLNQVEVQRVGWKV